MKSLFRCPLCGTPLEREETRWLCPNRHSFDRAAAGYVNLLPANKKHSRDPGDDRKMVAARAAYLSQLTGRPVKLVFSRTDSFLESAKRHPFRLRYKIGAKKDGRIVA